MKRLSLASHLFKTKASTILKSPALLVPPTLAFLIFVITSYAWIKVITKWFGDTNTLFTGLATSIPLLLLAVVVMTISEAVSSVAALSVMQTGKPGIFHATKKMLTRLPALLGWAMYKLVRASTFGVFGAANEVTQIASSALISSASYTSSFTIPIAMYENSRLIDAQRKSGELVRQPDVVNVSRATALYGLPVTVILLVTLFACLATEWSKPVFIASVVVIAGTFIMLSVVHKLIRAEILNSRMESD